MPDGRIATMYGGSKTENFTLISLLISNEKPEWMIWSDSIICSAWIIIIIIIKCFHKMSQKLHASKAQSQLDVKKPHRIEDNLNK